MLGESKTDIGKLNVEAGLTVRAIDACTAKSPAANRKFPRPPADTFVGLL